MVFLPSVTDLQWSSFPQYQSSDGLPFLTTILNLNGLPSFSSKLHMVSLPTVSNFKRSFFLLYQTSDGLPSLSLKLTERLPLHRPIGSREEKAYPQSELPADEEHEGQL